MKIDEAKQTRDKYLKIIGMTGDTGAEIIDVIIEPLGSGIFDKFRTMYIRLIQSRETVNTEKLAQTFKTDEYQVTVVLDYDGDCFKLLFDNNLDAYNHFT